ncbi:polyisoprenoid-binding protein YceI [Novosphingobium kunmingense]|uniref:Polyisoprenoid-binding protein YceI n=1 Tax=Novosphingobium kunmingense TaxID=1211806 RepID=A0A2N0I201_9SPHN|nr:YceI family protein [Novosphingobium kunmingense]PKB25213.1 polyisoprenoid-binding protein YceI [Novosphingobium kunmingense]
MHKRLLSVVFLTAALIAPLGAQPALQKPGSKSVTGITGGTYSVDPAHTLVSWTVDHFGFSPYTGIFGNVTGTLVLDPKNPAAARVDVSIPVAEVTTANKDLTGHLLRAAKEAGAKPDFFGPNPAPARFVSTGVKVLGNQRAMISGNLMLNGVTKPVVLAASFYGAGKAPAMMGGAENVGFTARATIKRSDFGLTFIIPLVSDEVTLDIAAAFKK